MRRRERRHRDSLRHRHDRPVRRRGPVGLHRGVPHDWASHPGWDEEAYCPGWGVDRPGPVPDVRRRHRDPDDLRPGPVGPARDARRRGEVRLGRDRGVVPPDAAPGWAQTSTGCCRHGVHAVRAWGRVAGSQVRALGLPQASRSVPGPESELPEQAWPREPVPTALRQGWAQR